MIPGVIPRPTTATRPMRRDWPAGLPYFGAFAGVDPGGAALSLQADRWLNRRLPLGLSFLDEYRWARFAAPTADRLSAHVGIRDNLVIAVPMVMQPTSEGGDGGTLAQVVAGTFDAYFTAAATAIAAKFPTAILRIGWEFNGDWYPWSALGDTAAWIAAFRHVVALFKAQSSAFEILWSPNISFAPYGQWSGYAYTAPPACWPGDDVVDYVGVSAYCGWRKDINAPNAPGATNKYPTAIPDPTMNAEVRWTREILGADYGVTTWSAATDPFLYCLKWAKGFADAHGKQLIIAEFAAGLDTTRAGRNIGDDGHYTAQIIAWAIANGVYAMFWWDKISDGGSFYGTVSADQSVTGFDPGNAALVKPACAAAIKNAFGA